MEFRPLVDADLPLMHRWLNEPGVVEWWEGEDVSWAAVHDDYGEDHGDAVEHWLAVEDGSEIGWIQCYAIVDHRGEDEVEAWIALGIPETAAGIDYLVGDPAARGRGVGTQMIGGFVDQIVFGRHPGWDPACASPYEANVGSWRALEKAGFRHAGTFDDSDGPCRLMARYRGDPAPHDPTEA